MAPTGAHHLMPLIFLFAALLLIAAALAPPAKEITVAIYARVSTKDQHCDMQLTDLRAHAGRMGWKIAAEYVETASGKAGARRPEQRKLLADAGGRKFDAVLVWRIDRFGRSISDFVQNVQTLDAAGVRFIVPSQGIDTDQRNPMANFLMKLLALFAELERELIVERVTAGVRSYRELHAAGKIGRHRHSKSGEDKPIGRPRTVASFGRARELRAQGWGWHRISIELGIAKTTLRRALGEPV
jgi:DNA invertase Pin-like site-specific DNA recombinase